MRLFFPATVLPTSYELPQHQIRSRARATPSTVYFIGALSLLYLVAFTYYRHVSVRDPTSFFFDRRNAYATKYSKQRTQEANAYIEHVNEGAYEVKTADGPPRLCIGIATVRRRGTQYVSTTVGSLLEGLSDTERKSIFLDVLIAHTNQSDHPNAADGWLQSLPDRVLHYDRKSVDFEQLLAWEDAGLYRNKTIYDYSYLLKDCYDSGAEYVAMIEDDTIAARGWYSQTLEALEKVSSRMQGRSQNRWAYLRLFYVEDLLGWNSEDWPRYLFWSFVVWSSLTTGMLWAKKKFRSQLESLTYTCIAIVSGLFVPLGIGLHFMAGRQTIWPIQTGIQKMNKYGCCSQALVFPSSIVPVILSRTDLITDWLVDMMIEKISDWEHLERWVLVPALFQHIGTTSSKGYGFDDNAKELWNFRFEDHPFS